MEPFGGILRPSIGSDQRYDVFDTVAIRSSRSAVGGLKFRPNSVEMARNFMCTLLLATLKDLVVFVWFCEDLVLEAALPVCSRMQLHIVFDVDEAK
ncbi:hypothetical protein AAC387_Pa12g0679 [Persea americana]